MAMRIVADSLDDLPVALRDKAQSGEGGFTVREMPEGWALEDVGGLKRSVVEARKERDEAQRTAKAFEGIDPEKAARARAAELQTGQTSYPAMYAEKGLDWETAQVDQAKALGLTVEVYRKRLADKLLGPVAPAVIPTPDKERKDNETAKAQ